MRTSPTKAGNGIPMETFVVKKEPRQLQLIGICRDTKGGSIIVPFIDLLFDWFRISCLTTEIFCFYLQNRLIQTSQIGGQWYSDSSPFSIPWYPWYSHRSFYSRFHRRKRCQHRLCKLTFILYIRGKNVISSINLMQFFTMGLYYKKFKHFIVISWSVCHCQALPSLSNICRQGWSLPEWSPLPDSSQSVAQSHKG